MEGNAPKEIHTILTGTLACFLPGLAKDLSAPLYYPSMDCRLVSTKIGVSRLRRIGHEERSITANLNVTLNISHPSNYTCLQL